MSVTRPRARGLVAALALSAGAACGLGIVGGDDETTDARGDASDTDHTDSQSTGAIEDAAVIDADASSPCKGTGGPTPIKVGEYCIDRTEVTRAQYAAFLFAGVTTQPSYCAFNTSFEVVATADELPMTSVDWCDAYAFCAWAGKRLCTQSEWRGGCAPVGQKYPYGSAYELGRCNDLRADSGGPVPVGSLKCESALGVEDMLGNVWEWIGDCAGSTGEGDPCSFSNGGAWSHQYDCDQTASGFTRRDKAADLGFRCCSDLR